MAPGENYCKLAFPRNSIKNNDDDDDSGGIVDRVSILGTNSAHSRDSRNFGEIPLCAVRSVAICKIEPKFEWLFGNEFEIK